MENSFISTHCTLSTQLQQPWGSHKVVNSFLEDTGICLKFRQMSRMIYQDQRALSGWELCIALWAGWPLSFPSAGNVTAQYCANGRLCLCFPPAYSRLLAWSKCDQGTSEPQQLWVWGLHVGCLPGIWGVSEVSDWEDLLSGRATQTWTIELGSADLEFRPNTKKKRYIILTVSTEKS